MSYVCNPLHAVINTYGRRMTLQQDNIERLYRYIWAIFKSRSCHLYRIGGIENHLHVLFDLNPNYALKDIMRDVKRESSKWIKGSGLFPLFEGWGKEYFAIGRSPEHLDPVIEYIKNQREHHKRCDFEDEMKYLLGLGGFSWSD